MVQDSYIYIGRSIVQ